MKAKKAAKSAIGIGTRKKSTARAVARAGKGTVRVNSFLIENYEPELYRLKLIEAAGLLEDKLKSIDVDIEVSGGGMASRTEAVRTALCNSVIAFSGDEALKERLKAIDRTLVVSDSRQKESKKPWGKGARSRWQKSYR